MSQTEYSNPRDRYKNKKKSQSLQSKKPLVSIVDEINDKNSCAIIQEQCYVKVNHPRPKRSRSTADLGVLISNSIMREDTEVLEKCLAKDNIKIDELTSSGMTPLQLACEIGNLMMVNMLVDAGADLFIKSKNQESALQIANKCGHFEIAEFLISIGAQENEVKDGCISL